MGLREVGAGEGEDGVFQIPGPEVGDSFPKRILEPIPGRGEIASVEMVPALLVGRKPKVGKSERTGRGRGAPGKDQGQESEAPTHRPSPSEPEEGEEEEREHEPIPQILPPGAGIVLLDHLKVGLDPALYLVYVIVVHRDASNKDPGVLGEGIQTLPIQCGQNSPPLGVGGKPVFSQGNGATLGRPHRQDHDFIPSPRSVVREGLGVLRSDPVQERFGDGGIVGQGKGRGNGFGRFLFP